MRSSVRAAALVGLLAVLVVLGARDVQIMDFHRFFGVLVVSVAAVLLIFGLTGRGDGAGTDRRRRRANESGARREG